MVEMSSIAVITIGTSGDSALATAVQIINDNNTVCDLFLRLVSCLD